MDNLFTKTYPRHEPGYPCVSHRSLWIKKPLFFSVKKTYRRLSSPYTGLIVTVVFFKHFY